MLADMLSPRYLDKQQLDLYFQLRCCPELMMYDKVARMMGFKSAALRDIFAAGLCPEPVPAFVSGEFWLDHEVHGRFSSFISSTASSEDIKAIADIVRDHDLAAPWSEPDDRAYILASTRRRKALCGLY